MNKFLEIFTKNKNLIYRVLFICIIATGIYFIYQMLFGNYVLVRFKDLGPLTKNMPVYYKGFVIGKTTHVGPDEDYKASIVKVKLNNEYKKLPKNTFVIVQNFPTGQSYLEFIYPDKPALQQMEKGDLLEGKTDYSLESFMHGQRQYGTSDIVSENVIKALESADATNNAMRHFFETSTQIMTENRQSINRTIRNTEKMSESLAKTAENLNQTSLKLNNSVDEANLKRTTSNVADATENIKGTTEDIHKATKDIDKTVKKLDSTLSELNATASNMNKITDGLYQVLGKKFAGLRIIFGRAIPNHHSENGCDSR